MAESEEKRIAREERGRRNVELYKRIPSVAEEVAYGTPTRRVNGKVPRGSVSPEDNPSTENERNARENNV